MQTAAILSIATIATSVRSVAQANWLMRAMMMSAVTQTLLMKLTNPAITKSAVTTYLEGCPANPI